MMMWGGEWEEAIAQARTAFALNPNSAFVISMLGCVLGFGGHREEALERLRQAMRASPHDPLIWLWTLWSGSVQFYARDFAAALETLRELIRLRPSVWWMYELAAGALAFRGRRDEARDMLRRMPAQPPGATCAISAKAALDAARGLRTTLRGVPAGNGRRGPGRHLSWTAAASGVGNTVG